MFVKKFLGITLALLVAVSTALFAEETSKPFIVSPTFSQVSYSVDYPETWTLIITDSVPIVEVWVNGKKQDIAPKETIQLKLPLKLEIGENKLVVEADNEAGHQSIETYKLYYHPDSEGLNALKDKNRGIDDKKKLRSVRLRLGQRQDSNAPQFSEELQSVLELKDSDLAANVNTAEFGFAYRTQNDAPGWKPSQSMYQYMYYREDYDSKDVGGFNFDELSYESHNLTGSWIWKQTKQAWGLSYMTSRLLGNTSTDKANEPTQGAGDKAFFHVFGGQYIRVHSPSWTSKFALNFVSKDFDQEPTIADDDPDSALSFGLSYSLLYYLPRNYGRMLLQTSTYREEAEGANRRFSQNSFGFGYEKKIPLKSLKSELKLAFNTLQKVVAYDEEVQLTSQHSLATRETTKTINDLGASWSYQQWLTASVAYRAIKADSTIEDYTYDANILSLDLGAIYRF